MARGLALLLLLAAVHAAGGPEQEDALTPVAMTGLAKSAFFVLRNLADDDAREVPFSVRVLTDEAGFDKFRQELEKRFDTAFQRQTFERAESYQCSRPYRYEDDAGAVRTVRLRLVPETAAKGARRALEFRADDALGDQAVAKFRLPFSEDQAQALFKREEFLSRKRELVRSAEKENAELPSREMLSLVEHLHLGAEKKGPGLALLNVSYQRTSYRLEIPYVGGAKKALLEIFVDQNIRVTNAKGESVEGPGQKARLVEIRWPVELAPMGPAELAKVPRLAVFKEIFARLESRRAEDGTLRAFFETRKAGPAVRTAISPEN